MSEYTKTVMLDREMIENVLADYKVMKADHVSKSALRSWCQGEIEKRNFSRNYYETVIKQVHADILDKFCQEDV